jgi:hypothetical protein
MGQISGSWGILEASAAPVEDSWFAARDIGAIGFYTGVRVFDTAGLVTEAVSHSTAWTDRNEVTPELVDAMMSLRPLGGEIYDGWETALARRPQLLQGYRFRLGDKASPNGFIATDRPPPSSEEVLRRYRALVSRFPQHYHLHTLYGEAVGAAVERRLRIVSAELAH